MIIVGGYFTLLTVCISDMNQESTDVFKEEPTNKQKMNLKKKKPWDKFV